MASAFDGIDCFQLDSIRHSLWAGESMASIRRQWLGADGKPTISAKLMREMRDELFEPLLADPDKVKALAAGPVINALELNKPRRIPDRHTRMARTAAKPVQIEMFPA